jgi:hypothetical protein
VTVDVRKLAILVEGKTGLSVGPIQLPRPSDVLYAHPNKDGTRKQCANCALWAEMDNRCLLMGAEIEVQSDQVCGYHVNGDPVLYVTTLGGFKLVEPDLAGLMLAPEGGTSCDRCRYYDPRTDDAGLCRGVFSEGKPAPVEALGCCARWVQRETP